MEDTRLKESISKLWKTGGEQSVLKDIDLHTGDVSFPPVHRHENSPGAAFRSLLVAL